MNEEPRLERYITAERAANNIMASLGLDSGDRGNIYMWMFECATEVGNFPASWEEVTVESSIADCKVEKPCDHVKTLQVYIKMSDGQCVRPFWTAMQPVKKMSASIRKPIVYESNVYGIEDDLHHFTLSSNANGKTLVLNYLRYMLDETGNILIDRLWLPALEFYVQYKHFNMLYTKGSGRFGAGDVQNAFRNFGAALQRAKGRHVQAKFTNDEKMQIAAKWNNNYYMPLNPYLRQQLAFNYVTHKDALDYITYNGYTPRGLI